jgi:integrase
METDMSRETGKATRHPGVYQVDQKTFRIRVNRLDPRKGKVKQIERLLKGVSLQEAVSKRAMLAENLCETGVASAVREKVGAFAKRWFDTKLPTLSTSTAERYVDGLENHVLNRTTGLGEFYFDSLRRMDVQDWVNRENQAGYAPATIRGWFNILRVLVRDAMADLGLSSDPTIRVILPELKDRTAPNALTPEQLSRFLAAMKADRLYSRNFCLTVLLAFTGLRFCHASSLKWEDIDFENGVIRVVRRQVRGKVGPVSRKKRAPKEMPLAPALAEILKEHRQQLVRRQNPGLAAGWVFPSLRGGLKTPGTLTKTWQGCLKAIGVKERFTVHGLRRTFNDLTRRAGADGMVTRALTGHVTESMTAHYSTVGLDEKRAAVDGVVRLVPLPKSVDASVDREKRKTAS